MYQVALKLKLGEPGAYAGITEALCEIAIPPSWQSQARAVKQARELILGAEVSAEGAKASPYWDDKRQEADARIRVVIRDTMRDEVVWESGILDRAGAAISTRGS